MRIAVFSSTYRPNIGGVETVTGRLAREFIGRGHEVRVFANRFPRSLPTRDRIDGIAVERRLYPNLIPGPGRRPWTVILKQVLSVPLGAYELFRLSARFRADKFDVVNIHYVSYPAAYALAATRLAGIPSVLSFHGSDVPSSPFPATYGWVARWSCARASIVTCGSENLAEYLRADMRERDLAKLHVCHFGIDVTERAIPASPNGFVLLPARLVEKKGVDTAIRAWKELPRRLPARLVIAGTGPEEAALRRLVADLSLDDSVEMAGAVDPIRLRAMMSRCRLVLIPSRWEAFGMVALEAMAASRPVVATRSGGVTEIVVDGETGRLVPPAEPTAMAAAMAELIDDPERARAMGEAGRRRALEHFSWSAVGDRYDELFRLAAAAGARI